MAVDNGKNKEANVERGCGVNPVSDDLPQENCILQDKEKSCGAEMTVEKTREMIWEKMKTTMTTMTIITGMSIVEMIA